MRRGNRASGPTAGGGSQPFWPRPAPTRLSFFTDLGPPWTAFAAMCLVDSVAAACLGPSLVFGSGLILIMGEMVLLDGIARGPSTNGPSSARHCAAHARRGLRSLRDQGPWCPAQTES